MSVIRTATVWTNWPSRTCPTRGCGSVPVVANELEVKLAQLRIDPDSTATRVLLAAVEELARLHLEDPAAHPEPEMLSYLRSLVDWAAGVTTG